MAVFAVILSMAVVFSPMVVSEDSEAAGVDEYYKYTMTTSLAVTDASGTAMTALSRTSDWNIDAGSWGFNDEGYGPFNSYYAAINPSTGKVLCHLNPDNLAQSVDSQTTVDGVAISNCNIMWVLPTVYIATSGNNLVMTNDPTTAGVSNAQAYAHTIDGKTYNYIALGVYEAYYDGIKLMSKSGVTPTASKTLINFRDYANNNTVDGGYAMVWNWHQYEIYRLCSLAVMERFDSQTTVGYGNAGGSASSTTGQLNTSPYSGSSSTNNKGVKLFIENAWGSLFEYLDDCYWSNGTIYAGQNTAGQSTGVGTSSGWTGGISTGYKSSGSGYGTGCSTNLSTWGMPTAIASSNSTSAPDLLTDGTSTSHPALGVVGDWTDGINAGVSYAYSTTGDSSSLGGSRLAMVFDTDPVAIKAVMYDHSALIGMGSAIGDTSNLTNGMATEVTIEDFGTTRYTDLGSVTSTISGLGTVTYTHTGWTVNGTSYAKDAIIPLNEDHTAVSTWTRTQIVTLTHTALVEVGGTDEQASSLVSRMLITDGATYPDLGTVGEAQHVGWYVDGLLYGPGDALVSTEDHEVFSAWKPPTITMTFKVESGGDWIVHSTIEVPKGSVGVVYTPTNVSGVFMGWFYESTYVTKYDSLTALNSDVTLYAKGVMPLEFTSVPTAMATITSVNTSGLVYFDATDSENYQTVTWDFGDGNTSSDVIAYNEYEKPGTYTVTLTVTNANGQTAVQTYSVTAGEVQDNNADNIAYIVLGIGAVIVGLLLVRRVL